MGHGHRAHWRQQCPAQGRAEAALFIQRKERAVGVGGIEESAVVILGPGERDFAPGAFRQRNRLALELARGNIVAPKVRGAVLAEDAAL